MFVPATLRNECTPERWDNDDSLLRVKCLRWGAVFYYELFRDESEARGDFDAFVRVEKQNARGASAKTCSGAAVNRPYFGTWSNPKSGARGELLCMFVSPDNKGMADRIWTVKGTPLLARVLYAGDREAANEGATRVWTEATS